MDNLKLLKELPDDSINLIYCDILYGTGKNFKDYNDLKPIKEEIYEFYKPRIVEMYRVLNKHGNIYLHMDYRIVHWIRDILDSVFGYHNFRNEIIWKYKGRGMRKDGFQNKHDNILRYSKSNDFTFNGDDVLVDYSPRAKKEFRHVDKEGRKYARTWKNGKMTPVYIKEGIIPDDVWDISMIYGSSKQKVDYCSQKPEELLEKIILSSSNKGGVVADFFMGSGTTMKVAKELGRNYIGCDTNPRAVEITEKRISS